MLHGYYGALFDAVTYVFSWYDRSHALVQGLWVWLCVKGAFIILLIVLESRLLIYHFLDLKQIDMYSTLDIIMMEIFPDWTDEDGERGRSRTS